MAIELDASTVHEWPQNEQLTGSHSFAHTCTGSNLVLIVTTGTVSSAGKITGVTYAGAAMTKLWDASGSTANATTGWYLVNPATGSNNVTVSLASATTMWNGTQGFCAISYKGANPPAAGHYGSTTGYGTALTLTITTAADELIVDSAYCGAALTVGTGQTRIHGTDTYGVSTQPGSTNGDMSWSSASSAWKCIGAVSLGPYVATGVALPILLNLQRQFRN